MSASRTSTLLAVLVLSLASLGARCGPAASFTVLGPLPEYDVTTSFPQTFTQAGALSDDGRVVAGRGLVHVPGTVNPITLGEVPFRYRNGVIEELAWPSYSVSWVNIAGDGKKIFINVPGSLTGFETWEGSSVSFTDLAPQISYLYGISDTTPDGSVMVGSAEFGTPGAARAYRYADGTVAQIVDPTGTRVLYGAEAISADGTLVAGHTQGNETFLFDAITGSIAFLGGLDPNATIPSLPAAMTPDGRVIVGTAEVGFFTFEPYRWQDGQMVGLGVPAGATSIVGATDVSADGSVVVGGKVYPSQGEDDAFVWDPTNGMRRLRDALTEQGVDLTGWKLESANAVSALGNEILGTAIDAQGNRYAFLAELPRSLAKPTP